MIRTIAEEGTLLFFIQSAIFSESSPQNWIEFSQENLRKSEREREASVRLRGGIAGMLSQVISSCAC